MTALDMARGTSVPLRGVGVKVPPRTSRTRVGAGRELARFDPPPVIDCVLPQGVRVLLLPRRTYPLASLQVVVSAGAFHDDPGREGLACLTASLIRSGTRDRDAGTIAAVVEQAGADLLTGADWDRAVVMLDVLAPDVELAVDLLAELTWRPVFPGAAFAANRGGRVHRLKVRNQARRPGALAEDHFFEQLYGQGPYGVSELGTVETLSALTVEQVRNFHERCYRCGPIGVIAVGDFDPDDLARRLEGSLPDLSRSGPAPREPQPQPAGQRPRVLIVDHPDARQVELRIGHLAPLRRVEDRPKLELLNAILGGTELGRLERRLRLRAGITYRARSRFLPLTHCAPFLIEAAVQTDAAAAAAMAIHEELELLRQQPVGRGELEEKRAQLLGSFPLLFQTHHDLVGQLRKLLVDRSDLGWSVNYAEAIVGLEAEEVLELARAYLAPANLTIVAVGPRSALRRQFEPYEDALDITAF